MHYRDIKNIDELLKWADDLGIGTTEYTLKQDPLVKTPKAPRKKKKDPFLAKASSIMHPGKNRKVELLDVIKDWDVYDKVWIAMSGFSAFFKKYPELADDFSNKIISYAAERFSDSPPNSFIPAVILLGSDGVRQVIESDFDDDLKLITPLEGEAAKEASFRISVIEELEEYLRVHKK